ncbi:hypothetical protein Mapa_001777 [Marchantia paleacea]|nr:hypothetical protein Mapa_001777 [Marchantia paleacea]
MLRRMLSVGCIQHRNRSNGFSELSKHSLSMLRREVSPLLQLPYDANLPKTAEELKEILKQLGDLIDSMPSTKPTHELMNEGKLNYFKACLQTNIPLLGSILDKIGGAANSQGTGTQSETHGNLGKEATREISTILKNLGQIHSVGAFLVILGLTMDRCLKLGRNRKEFFSYMKILRDLGNHVVKIQGLVCNSEADEILQKATLMICDHAAFCDKMAHSQRKFVKRFLLAEADHEKLMDMQKETDYLYRELHLATLYGDLHGVQGTDFEPSEDTVLVGIEMLVEEEVLKLESSDHLPGGRALVVCGLPGVGKTSVGEQIAARLRWKFDPRYVRMLNVGSESKTISVTEFQQSLYKKLSRTGVKKEFSSEADGRKHLRMLFNKLEKPVLILFDNVRNFMTIDSLLPSDMENLLQAGSLLLVTTTNQQVINVLEGKKVRTFVCEVRELEEKQARDLLLKKMLGDMDVNLQSDLSRELMRYEDKGELMLRKLLKLCGGLPLAINCVGSRIWGRGHDYLRSHSRILSTDLHNLSLEAAYAQLGEHEDVREGLMKKLRDAVLHACNSLSQGDPITSEESPLDRSVNFAYEQISYNHRTEEAFLNIVHLHLGRKWTEVEMLCGTEQLETLRQLSMVRRLVYKDGQSSPIVNVHDVLIGVGRRVANLNYQGRWVVKENGDEIDECFHNYQLESNVQRPEFIKLDHCNMDLPAGLLDNVTRNLRYLEVVDTTITGTCSIDPLKLECLKLERSPLPFPVQRLQKLIVLHLDFENTTSNLESIQFMPNLAKVTVKNSTTLRKLGPGLSRLSEVRIHNCSNFESIQGLDPHVVQQLEIAHCTIFSDFARVRKLRKLATLSLVGFQHSTFPEDLEIPSGVQDMDFSRNYNLTALPRFTPRNKIRILNLGSCCRLREVSDVHSTNLEYLHLGGCSMLEHLILSDDNVKTLKHLEVQGCASSKLRHTIASIRARFPTSFRLIPLDWLKVGDEEYTAPTSCEKLHRCIKLSLRKTRDLFEQRTRTVSFKDRGRSFTFPSSNGNRSKLHVS